MLRHAFLGVVVCLAYTAAAFAQEPPKPGPEHQKLKELEGTWDSVMEMAGQESKGELLQIKLRVLKAELDLCATDKERIAVHEKMVAVLKAIEQQARELARERAAAAGTLLEARLNRLEAEIALERARAKSVTPSK